MRKPFSVGEYKETPIASQGKSKTYKGVFFYSSNDGFCQRVAALIRFEVRVYSYRMAFKRVKVYNLESDLH